MCRYGIWNLTEDEQELNNLTENEVINYADIERTVNTAQNHKVKTLKQAQNLLESIGYRVEQI